MADEPKRHTKWIPSKSGSIPEIYTNYTMQAGPCLMSDSGLAI